MSQGPHQDPEVVGVYRILSVLGRGGMGVVYLAEGPGGERVALKTLNAVDTDRLGALRRELRALGRLNHPAVVRVLDEGVDEGVPWVVMEFIEGHTLTHHLGQIHARPSRRTSPTQPAGDETLVAAQADSLDYTWPLSAEKPRAMSIRGGEDALTEAIEALPSAESSGAWDAQGLGGAVRRLLEWMAQVCHALAYVHGLGVVHCDLKPDNILVTPEGRVVLVDFGLASDMGRRLGAEALENAGLVAGTTCYMSPERIGGLSFDARSDLYAMGCILYEILTGRVPFTGSGAAAFIMHQHLAEAPPPISDLTDGVPLALEVLVRRLLAKRPGDRPGHAHAVLGVFERLGLDVRAPVGAPEPRAYLYQPSLSGRDDLVEQLGVRFNQARHGEGGAVALVGESGVGKTAVAVSVVQQARARGVEVLTSRCASGEGIAPLQIFAGVLSHVEGLCLQGGEVLTEVLLGARGPVLAPYAPSLASLPGQARQPEPGPLPARLARLRLYRAMVGLLDALCSDRPLLWIVDDLQWIDALSLGFLGHLRARESPKRRWLVLGLCRSEGADAIASWVEGEGVEEVLVGRLGPRSVSSMIAQMLGLDEAPEALSKIVVERAAGHPFFVAEYLQLALEAGLLILDQIGQWRLVDPETSVSALPLTVRAVVASRLDMLSDDARRICDAASVLGGPCRLKVLIEVCRLSEAALEVALEELRQRHIMEAVEGSGIRFVHDIIAEVALEEQVGSVSAILHRRAAEALIAQGDAEPWRLAWHWRQSGERLKACRASLEAARLASGRHDHSATERLCTDAIDLSEPDSPEALAARLLMAGDVLRPQGRVEEARALLEVVLDQARRQGLALDEARGLCVLGELDSRSGGVKAALVCFESARDIYKRVGDRRGLGTALNNMGNAQRRLGRYREALALYLRALDIRREVGDRRGEGITLNNMANACYNQGRYDEAMALYLQALHIQRAVGNRVIEGTVLSNVALIHHIQGRYGESLSNYEEALGIHREVGDRHGEAGAYHSMADALCEQGHLERARSLYTKAMGLWRGLGARSPQGYILAGYANIERCLGHKARAVQHLHEALQLHRTLGDRASEAHALVEVAQVCLDDARLDEVGLYLDEARSVAEDNGDRRLLATVSLRRARLRRLQGRLDEALGHLDAAEAIFVEGGDRYREGLCQCERGQLAMARGLSPAAHAKKARQIVSDTVMAPTSALSLECARLGAT